MWLFIYFILLFIFNSDNNPSWKWIAFWNWIPSLEKLIVGTKSEKCIQIIIEYLFFSFLLELFVLKVLFVYVHCMQMKCVQRACHWTLPPLHLYRQSLIITYSIFFFGILLKQYLIHHRFCDYFNN